MSYRCPNVADENWLPKELRESPNECEQFRSVLGLFRQILADDLFNRNN